MSIDLSVHLFFPRAGAAAALRALGAAVMPPGFAMMLDLPTGGSVAVTDEGFDDAVQAVGEGAEVHFDAAMTVTRRRKKRLARPVVDKWGDVQRFRIVKDREEYGVAVGLEWGREFFEVSLSNITRDLSLFDSNAFRAHVGSIFAAGDGVAAAACGQGEWTALSDEYGKPIYGGPEIQAPERLDAAAGVDDRVAALQEALASPNGEAE